MEKESGAKVSGSVGDFPVSAPIQKSQLDRLTQILHRHEKGVAIALWLGLFGIAIRILTRRGDKIKPQEPEVASNESIENKGFVTFFQDNWLKALNIARPKMKGYDKAEIEDLVAEVFTDIFFKYGNQDASELRKLRNAALHNALANLYRDASRHPRVPYEDELQEEFSREDILEEVIERLDKEQLAEMIQGLSPTERLLVVLKLSGLENRDIGRTLHISESATKSRYHKIVQKLREKLI
ncbi:RNA polymerase sigma factor [Candidatus Roizmanbacteria bacterium]|nr:RNA polymerase sigma factor [Candidatus Roizmanbacteria bacterium]